MCNFGLLLRVLYLFALCSKTFSLFEDQIGKFDWRLQYIGNTEHYAIGQHWHKHPFLYLASDSHVLGALHQYNGSLAWRQVLEENGRFLSINLCGNYIFTLSLRINVLLRVWNPTTGHLIEEFLLLSKASDGNLICDTKNDNLFVISFDKLLKIDANLLTISKENVFSDVQQQHSGLVASDARGGVVAAVFSTVSSSALSSVIWDTNTSDQTKVDSAYSQISIPDGGSLDKCILSKLVLICTSKMHDRTYRLISIEMANSSTWNIVDLESSPLKLIEAVDGKIIVQLETKKIAVYILEKGTSRLRYDYDIKDVSVFAVHRNQIIFLKQFKANHFNNLKLTAVDVRTGQRVESNFPEYLNLSRHHGAVKKIAVMSGERGLLIFTQEGAVQMISVKGNQAWLREESLAQITAVEMIDLPVSTQDATMQEEFGQSDAGVLELFINRITSQVHQLSVAFNSWWNGERTIRLDGHLDGFTKLTRDVHNLHKMLVIVTSVGKIFGIESSRGGIVWQYFMPDTRLPNTARHLFLQRTTGHFPLIPVACVLLERLESPESLKYQSVLFYLNPILGVPLNAMTLKPLVTVNAEEEAIVRLPRTIRLAVLVPTMGMASVPNPIAEGKSEATNHVQPLCAIMEDLSVMLLPPPLSTVNAVRNLLPEHGLHVFELTAEPASVSGYRLVISDTNKTGTGDVIIAQPIWHMHLSSEECPQSILQAEVHPFNEHVYSIGRVLGDRNVLYKYVNPNLLAVMTGGVSRADNGLPTVSLYLIDTVVGQIIHSVVHRRASEPTSLVVSENWVLYSVYNQRSLRIEFTVMELFEPLYTTVNLVPTPWDIIVRNLVPTPSSIVGSEDVHRQFSSIRRAAHSAHGGIDGVLVPDVLQRAFILASPLRSGALAVSLTERGITPKSLLFGLETGNLLELPKSLLDPRRSVDMTPELQEGGLEPYTPELPLSTLAVISYNLTLERIQSIHTAPSGLESTCLVFAHGLDLFFTRIAPARTFDMLRDDFDYWFIAMIVVGLIVASYVAKRFAARRELSKAWN